MKESKEFFKILDNLFGQGHFNEVLEKISRSELITPSFFQTHLVRILVYKCKILLKRGQYKETEKNLQKAYKKDPRNKFILTLFVTLYLEQTNENKCFYYLQQLINTSPNSIKVLSTAKSIYKKFNNKNKLIETCLQIKKFDPQNIENLNELALYYLSQRKLSKAKECFKQSLALNTDQSLIKEKFSLTKRLLEPKKAPNILFLHLLSGDPQREEGAYDIPVLPIGLNILMSKLTAKKISFDLRVLKKVNQNIVSKLLTFQKPNIIALSVSEGTVEKVLQLLAILEKKDVFVLLGGPFITLAPKISQEIFKHKNIIFLRGEVEETFPKLIQELSASKTQVLNSLPGLSFAAFQNKYLDNVFLSNEDMEKQNINYHLLLQYSGMPNVLTISSSRGCPYACNFCAQPEGKRYRFASSKKIVSDIEKYYQLVKNTAFPSFFVSFVDNDFLVNKNRVIEFIELLSKKDFSSRLKIIFQTSINSLLKNREIIPNLKKINVHYIDIGSDSFVDTDLKRLGKAGSLKDIETVTALLEKHQIPNEQNTILSNIETTTADFQAHLENILKLHEKYKYFRIGSINKYLIPNINTRTYQNIIQNNLLKHTRFDKISENYIKIHEEYPKDKLLRKFLESVEIDLNYNNSKEENYALIKKLYQDFKKVSVETRSSDKKPISVHL
ncbi:radical SAM protein [Candidatus Margulisiibacteriota bacterium]